MIKRVFAWICFCLILPVVCLAVPPIPFNIGGTVVVDGTVITQSTDSGYTFRVTRPDGIDFTDAVGNPAEDADGLNSHGLYNISIPIYDASEQPGGANPGEKALIRVYRHGAELSVISPFDGEITIGESGEIRQINIVADRAAENLPPTADAGSDQVVNEGGTVTLNGSNSSDPDDGITSYQWEQTSGPAVVLSDISSAKPGFTAPSVGPNGATLTFRLTVTDHQGATVSDTCSVTVRRSDPPGSEPIADAGQDQTVREGTTVTLDGSNSWFPDDKNQSYKWAQKSGKPVTLSDPSAVMPTFVTPAVRGGDVTLTFELTVKNTGENYTDTDEVAITVYDNGFSGFPEEALTVLSATDMPVAIMVENGELVFLEALCAEDYIMGEADMHIAGDNFPYGLFDIKIKADSPGAMVTVTFFFPYAAKDNAKWYQHASGKGWSDYSAHVSFNESRDQAGLTLIDGDAGDPDGEKDGFISIISGLTEPTDHTEPDDNGDEGEKGSSGSSSGCFLSVF